MEVRRKRRCGCCYDEEEEDCDDADEEAKNSHQGDENSSSSSSFESDDEGGRFTLTKSHPPTRKIKGVSDKRGRYVTDDDSGRIHYCKKRRRSSISKRIRAADDDAKNSGCSSSKRRRLMLNDDNEVPKSGGYDDDDHHHHYDTPHPSLSRIKAEVKELKKQMIEINVESSPLTETSWQLNSLEKQQQQSVQNEFLQEQKDDSKYHYGRSYESSVGGTEGRVTANTPITFHQYNSNSGLQSSELCKNGPLCRLREKKGRGGCVLLHSNRVSRTCRYGDRCRNALEGKCIFLH